ncbi:MULTISPECIES: TrkH family potassium uptake protein [unclassified Ectothiorhodospira]|uniref:TrkH family potassium uptake protein n=1 Tax=unclassified Ectothiorhodospira TaxID=2684909 RepID=UPI001EE7E988|nr:MULTISPECIES: TrkH family potassium uptake protein [unclassified Ectothiorhodospira]MCG5514521.1 TrkH family potassium uptake protein [Ectothiorhodospira sp. 9100]MCG5518675.1 TrkH family potassium uptake protein [Ectothiorhodospira sp. 9905]
MHWASVLRVVGLLLMLFSGTMLPPAIVSLIYDDGGLLPFIVSFGVLLALGLLLWLPVCRSRQDLRTRDGFLIVVLFWTVLGLSGALPLTLSQAPSVSFTDAAFESMSGLTTTGATVLVGIDDLPESIRFYRQQLQWLGGMGIIVLAVAILPMIGVGGMQLYRAETPGPVKDTKLTPRIAETAKALWYIYLTLTVACASAYWLAGMNAFDAIGHSFSTVAIGGFSTHDASIGHFDSPVISMICVVFMLIAGINFAMHFMAWRTRSLTHYLKEPEVRWFLGIMGILMVVVVVTLVIQQHFDQWGDALHHGVFQAVSIGTTAGFTTDDFANWPIFLPVLLVMAAFIGGCAMSTGGGIKVIRFMLLIKQGYREVIRLVHPQALVPIKVGGKPVPDRVIDAVWGFFATYIALFALMMLTLMATGLDQVTAFSAVAATITNLGPGLGAVAENFAAISDLAKWVLMFAMLLGRLEVFTLLVLLTPAFWRH